MNPYNGFILSIILLLPLMPLPKAADPHCQNMNLEIKVAAATDQGATISLSMPADLEAKIFLMPGDGSGVPKEVAATRGELRNVARGEYEIVIQDVKRKYCSEMRKLTVN